MKAFIFAVLCLLITGCAGAPMKRCDGPFSQPDVMSCKEQVQGAYRLCEKTVDLYHGCVSPQ